MRLADNKLNWWFVRAAAAMGDLDSSTDGSREFRPMTVANIRESATPEYVEVMFLESARFYRLEKRNPRFSEILGALKGALCADGHVMVAVEKPNSEVLVNVKAGRQH